MSFVPPGQSIPKPPSDYLKLEDGENKVRILADSIGGWKYQSVATDKMVYSEQVPKVPLGEIKNDMFGNSSLNYFIAAPVWSYKDEEVKLMEIQQISIMNAIEAMENDSDWGDAKEYDIKIKKTGQGKETRYNVSGNPNKEPIKPEWLEELEEKKKNEKTGYRFECKWEDKVEPEPEEEPKEEEVIDLPF